MPYGLYQRGSTALGRAAADCVPYSRLLSTREGMTMVDFSLPDEIQKIRDMAREFARKEVRPAATELDRMQEPEQAYKSETLRRVLARAYELKSVVDVVAFLAIARGITCRTQVRPSGVSFSPASSPSALSSSPSALR